MIRLKPGCADCFCDRSHIYDLQRKYDEAIADLNEVTRLIPDYPACFYKRADIYKRQGKYDEAISDLIEATRLIPAIGKTFYYLTGVFSGVFYNRPGVCYLQGKCDESIVDYGEAIRLNIQKPGYSSHIHESRGNLNAKWDEYNKAITRYTEGIYLASDNKYLQCKYFCSQGTIHDKKETYEKALCAICPWVFCKNIEKGLTKIKHELSYLEI